MLENGTDNFVRTEAIFTKVSNAFNGLVMFSGTVYCLMPAARQWFAYLTDSVTDDTYLAPFRDM